MNIFIRNYKHSDYHMINNWWITANEKCPPAELMPEDTTFILELNKKPILSVTLYLTNCKELAYIENFVGNPDSKGEDRKKCGKILLDHILKFGKEFGYKRFLGFAYKDKLKNRYSELGLKKTENDFSVFVKEV